LCSIGWQSFGKLGPAAAGSAGKIDLAPPHGTLSRSSTPECDQHALRLHRIAPDRAPQMPGNRKQNGLWHLHLESHFYFHSQHANLEYNGRGAMELPYITSEKFSTVAPYQSGLQASDAKKL
jgi:hypothetical protein